MDHFIFFGEFLLPIFCPLGYLLLVYRFRTQILYILRLMQI